MHFHVRTYDLGHKAAQGDLGKKDHFRIGHAMPSVGLEGDRGSFFCDTEVYVWCVSSESS